MADARDLLNAWQDAVKQLAGVVSPVTGPAGDLLEQVLNRQVEFEKQLVGRVLGPLHIVVDSLEKTSAAMRIQAQAFQAASAAFKQSAELLELQAATLERATQALRDPADFLRSAGGLVPRDKP
jgi:hypothetical protein